MEFLKYIKKVLRDLGKDHQILKHGHKNFPPRGMERVTLPVSHGRCPFLVHRFTLPPPAPSQSPFHHHHNSQRQQPSSPTILVRVISVIPPTLLLNHLVSSTMLFASLLTFLLPLTAATPILKMNTRSIIIEALGNSNALDMPETPSGDLVTRNNLPKVRALISILPLILFPKPKSGDLIPRARRLFEHMNYGGVWRDLVLLPDRCRDLSAEFPDMSSLQPAQGVECSLFLTKDCKTKHNVQVLTVTPAGNQNVGKKYNDKVKGIICNKAGDQQIPRNVERI
ncbi:uncharacterized protein BDR25DRAFT_356718 [Lindgomyces ingoldianus]|uniref:Uncharacterized protein n=1 Tax=Lindgomyces ingoldianus TaxID=673940 RepID=A0ACB6QR92_9PLEO|nr:uncharacterized protein BDR25DRAFT_356718 [Lindgomyces ingoldianus]KAF2469498.1 hypothetical protein BDR25DRAFT_356718 [Lindgomyces ingoldianus]